jgi:hypothetical protein
MFQLEVAPGVIFAEGEWRGRFPSGNVLVLEGSRTRAIVDTGAGEEVLSAVVARGRVDVVILASWEEFLRYTGFDVFGTSEAFQFRQTLGWAATPVAREQRILARSLPGFLKAEYFMVKHHMDRLTRAGRARLAQPDGDPSATTDSDHVGGNQLWQAL